NRVQVDLEDADRAVDRGSRGDKDGRLGDGGDADDVDDLFAQVITGGQVGDGGVGVVAGAENPTRHRACRQVQNAGVPVAVVIGEGADEVGFGVVHRGVGIVDDPSGQGITTDAEVVRVQDFVVGAG